MRSLQNKEIIIVNSKKAEVSNPKLELLQAGSSAAVAKQRSKGCSAPRVGLGLGLLLPHVFFAVLLLEREHLALVCPCPG